MPMLHFYHHYDPGHALQKEACLPGLGKNQEDVHWNHWMFFQAQPTTHQIVGFASNSRISALNLCLLKTSSFETLPSFCCSVTKLCPTLYDPMDCSIPGFPLLHYLLEVAQTHVHWVGDAIKPSHLLSSPYPPAFNLSQHQNLFQWVSSLHQVAKVLELQLLPQSFQWIFRVDFL